jgi:alanyl-tRNA synthetase
MTLLAGISAYEDYEQIADNNQGIRELVSAKRYETYDKTKELSDKCQKLLEENVRLKKEMTDIIFEKYKKILDEKKDEDFSPLLIFTESLDNVQLRNLINNCTERYDGLVAGFIGNDMDGYRYIIGASKNCHIDIEGVTGLKELAANLAKNLSGRGGGNDDMIQGSLQTSEKEIRKFFGILP